MTERHATVRDGNFYPFKEVTGDFNLDEVAERLELNTLQKQLLEQWLNQLEIKIWYWDKHGDDDLRDDPPGLEVVVFWKPFECHVSSADLFDLLGPPLEQEFLDIDNDKEVAVLEKLKTMADKSIAAHNRELPE